ncbi:hypothetical protein ACWERV_21940 [Streptomyces sp. NPDC004031]
MEQWQGRSEGQGRSPRTAGRSAGPNQWVKDQIDAMIDAAPLPPIPPPGPMGRGCRALRSALRRGRAARTAGALPATAPSSTSARTP